MEQHTDINQGLTTQEAKARLEKYGYNKLQEAPKRSLLLRFLDQFKDAMIVILLVAAAISFFVSEPVDAIIILAIVVINAFLGLYQEGKAESALEGLQKLSSPISKVLRDGVAQVIPSEELVIGDLVILEAGDLVSADLRLVKTSSLKIEEASLTGESVPVEKDANAIVPDDAPLGDHFNMAYSSGQITYGRGTGQVVATGMDTEVGKIAASLTEQIQELTPLQKQLNHLGKVLGIVAIIAVAVIFLIGLFNGQEPLDMFMVAISLAVAVIPESLPTVSTIVLALGVQRMVEKNAIIRTLPSVETLGSTSIICSDKTGTLTQNVMTIVDSFSFVESNDLMIKGGYLCNDSRVVEDGLWVGDPTETAISRWSVEQDPSLLEASFERIAEVPFDSKRKRMTTVNKVHDENLVFVKGGMDEILDISTQVLLPNGVAPLTDELKDTIQYSNIEMAERALRVLAIAYKPAPEVIVDGDEGLESDLIFLGLVGMIDPPRPEVKQAIKECIDAQITPIMITGDHQITAAAIARDIGLLDGDKRVVSGRELDTMSDQELRNQIYEIGVFARVSPQHKMRIIEAFQYHNEIVAMTGDGVNDAPALKRADIGAAMGIVGTEVAKSAADMVLTDDNFATVVNAVAEGRRIKDNIKKAISFLLSCNLGELTVLLFATIMSWATPLIPIHILWINLVTDSLPALALGMDPEQDDIMQRGPDRSNSLFTGPMAYRVVYQGIMIGILTLFGFMIGNGWLFGLDGNLEQGRTMAFAVLGFSQLVHSFNIHSANESVFKTLTKNKFLIYAVIINALMMFAVLLIDPLADLFKLVPLDSMHWLLVGGLSILPWFVVELMKVLKLNGKQ